MKSTRYYLSPAKTATIRKERDNKCAATAAANWYSHCGKQSGGPQTAKKRTAIQLINFNP